VAARVRTRTFAKGGAGFKRIRVVARTTLPDAEVLEIADVGHFPPVRSAR
jgi:hypothetical protein